MSRYSYVLALLLLSVPVFPQKKASPNASAPALPTGEKSADVAGRLPVRRVGGRSTATR
jgi:hypothetical protein